MTVSTTIAPSNHGSSQYSNISKIVVDHGIQDIARCSSRDDEILLRRLRSLGRDQLEYRDGSHLRKVFALSSSSYKNKPAPLPAHIAHIRPCSTSFTLVFVEMVCRFYLCNILLASMHANTLGTVSLRFIRNNLVLSSVPLKKNLFR